MLTGIENIMLWFVEHRLKIFLHNYQKSEAIPVFYPILNCEVNYQPPNSTPTAWLPHHKQVPLKTELLSIAEDKLKGTPPALSTRRNHRNKIHYKWQC